MASLPDAPHLVAKKYAPHRGIILPQLVENGRKQWIYTLFPHSFPQALCKLNLAELFDFLWEVLSLNRKTGIRILAIAIAVVLALSLLLLPLSAFAA